MIETGAPQVENYNDINQLSKPHLSTMQINLEFHIEGNLP
jgi:hypothetical protein